MAAWRRRGWWGRGAQAEEAAAGPGADGEQHRTEDRDELEGHVIGDDPPADGDEEVGDREIEGVEREAVVPARIPTGEMAVADQGFEELGHRDVRARVPPGRRRIGEQHARVQLRERHDDDAGDGDHGDGSRYPPPGSPGGGLARRLGLRWWELLQAHHIGPGFRHVEPSAIQRGQGRNPHRCRSATSGLRYRRDPPTGVRGGPSPGAPGDRRRPLTRHRAVARELRDVYRAMASNGASPTGPGSSAPARIPRSTG